jgi:hypothetical protein
VNSSAATSDLHVTDAGSAELLLFVPCTAKDCVGVRVDQTGRKQFSGAIDSFGLWKLILELCLSPDSRDFVVSDCNCDAGEKSCVAHFASASRTCRTLNGCDL